MSVTIAMPKLDMSMMEGTLAEWLVADGESVTEGDVIYLLEADKSTQEITAPASGVLRHKLAAGETCAVGTVVAEIE